MRSAKKIPLFFSLFYFFSFYIHTGGQERLVMKPQKIDSVPLEITVSILKCKEAFARAISLLAIDTSHT